MRRGTSSTASTSWTYVDALGNVCRRLMLPEGRSVIRFDAYAEVPPEPDAVDTGAVEIPPEALPDAVLARLPSRFCPSDELGDFAWELFGALPQGWPRVHAISDWVHREVSFDYCDTASTTTALDVLASRAGVCRDFAHLGVALCRALSIPARYAFGYLPDIGVPPSDTPTDFCAWMEVYLGGQWWTFDPRQRCAAGRASAHRTRSRRARRGHGVDLRCGRTGVDGRVGRPGRRLTNREHRRSGSAHHVRGGT